MKLNFILSVLAYVAGHALFAQTNMTIYQSNGTILQIPLSSIDSITYSNVLPDDLPQLTTSGAVDIATTSAGLGGNVLDQGAAPVTERGVCWSQNSNPTIFDFSASSGSGLGSFTVTLSGLDPSTTYYARAYATNAAGTAYGNQVTFQTLSMGGNLPTVITTPISEITGTTAVVGGTVTADGGETIISRGICWNTSPNPTTANNILANGLGLGQFSATLTALQNGTTYYVRAYATNINGTSYGEQVVFITPVLAQVITGPLSDIGTFSVTCGGNITNDGGAPVTERGIIWSVNNVGVSQYIPNGSGSGIFEVDVMDLPLSNLEYTIQAFAVNSAGTAYGNVLTFTTLPHVIVPTGTGVTDIDGNFYNSMIYPNGQEWMIENLKTTHYSNGDEIPNVIPAGSWDVLTTGAWCYYDNNASNNSLHGKLYNGFAVLDPRNVCPSGWHVPNNAEILSLADVYGGSAVAEDALMTTDGSTYYEGYGFGATNESGFTGIPSGRRYSPSGAFGQIGFSGDWWLSTPIVGEYASSFSLPGMAPGNSHPATSGFSVRCLRD